MFSDVKLCKDLNNSFRIKYSTPVACWWESVKPIQFYCSCLPAVLDCLATCLLTYKVIFWLNMLNTSNNLAIHALANCCKDSRPGLSLAHLINLVGLLTSDADILISARQDN